MNDSPQGSGGWLMDRCGMVTASRFKDVMAKLKSGAPAKARDDYLWEVVIERLTGQPAEHYASAAMQWGTDNEEASRMAYERTTGALVEKVGFRRHPTIAGVGGSPDGLVDADGGWESKSPFNSAIHLQTVLAGGVPAEHWPQVQGLMWITERAWWDFQSYDPRMPAGLDAYIHRVLRDDDYIAGLQREVEAFLGSVQELVETCGERVQGGIPAHERTEEPAPYDFNAGRWLETQ